MKRVGFIWQSCWFWLSLHGWSHTGPCFTHGTNQIYWLTNFSIKFEIVFFFFLRFKVSRKPLSRPIRIRAGLIHQGTKLFQHEFYLFMGLEFEFLLKREWMLNYLNQLISDCLWHCTHKYWIPLRKVTRGFSPSSSNRQCCVIERSGCGTTYPIVLITCVSWHGPMGGRNRFDVITKVHINLIMMNWVFHICWW